MNRFLSSAMSILLAFSILGAAIGMPLTRHLCQMSETLTISVGAAEHLCGQPEQQPCTDDSDVVLKDACCQFTITHTKAHLLSLLKAEGKLLLSPALAPVIVEPYIAFVSFPQFRKESLPLASDSSPPLAGRSLLTFISLLQI